MFAGVADFYVAVEGVFRLGEKSVKVGHVGGEFTPAAGFFFVGFPVRRNFLTMSARFERFGETLP